MRPTTNTAGAVKAILYDVPSGAAIRHGREYEPAALEPLSAVLKKNIIHCGIFLHPKFHHLGATPDGLIGKDTLVEVKCPYSARAKKIAESISAGEIPFWSKKTGNINKNHKWFYQIQGQLRITGRKFCYLGVWTFKDFEKVKIKRDMTNFGIRKWEKN